MNISTKKLPNIVSDTIGGDTIVINISTGAYYSLTTLGALAWHAHLNNGISLDLAPAILCMMEEGLLKVEEIVKITAANPIEVFEKYTDMESLLMADPIHEVDEFGWPRLK
jgi:hypothetical protein